MEESIRLGRIAGIRVGANWSLLVIFWLITWGLAAGRFPEEFPNYSDGAYWAAGAVTALVFYGALLAHELGHALVARKQGIPVEGITLWLFGGVTTMEGEATSPGGAWRVAVVGPLVSLGAAAGFGALAVVLDRLSAPALLGGMAAWLAVINLVLALFNLIPAAPLDGGRILQALLWWRSGERLRAAASAARVGRGFGYLLIALGLVQFSSAAGVGGLWLVFIGWFLLVAARTEQLGAEVRLHLDGVRVADVMTPDPSMAPGWVTVANFLDEYAPGHRLRAFPVERFDGQPGGLVTLDRLETVPSERRTTVRVADVAFDMEDVPAAGPEEMVLDVLGRMSGRSDGWALVTDGGRVVGVVSLVDVVEGRAHAERGDGQAPTATARQEWPSGSRS